MRHGSTHRGSGSFLTFPVSGGALLNLVAFIPTDLDVEESWSAPGDVAALAAAYNGWAKQVRQVIEAMDHTVRWGIYDRAPPKTWSTDHAVTPHLGQGANQAVEDAITLAVLLQDAQAADIPMRLRRYEDLRIERTRQVHDGSREAGALYRSTELSPGQHAERIVAINDRLQLDTHDAERIANDALSAL